MTAEEWADHVPLHRIRTGVSANLKLNVYSDGQGTLSSIDDPPLHLPLRQKRDMQAAFRILWDRAVHEASTRSPFTD